MQTLYKLLSKYFWIKRSPYTLSYSQRQLRRGLGGMGGCRGFSGFRGPPQHKPSYIHDQGSSSFAVPKKPVPYYPRESRPYTQSLPLSRTEPDMEELLKRLEQKADGRLVEQVMARLDVESNAIENALKANLPDEQPSESKEASADIGEAQLTDAKRNIEKSDEGVKPEPPELELEPLDDFELDELEWLDEEMHKLVFEIKDSDADAEPPDLDLLENVGTDVRPNAVVPESIVAPELSDKQLEPMLDIVDPLKPLEPGIAELEEEAEDEEAGLY